MSKTKDKTVKRERRHLKIRAKISGTAKCPRLSVFKSNTGMFLQLIDDRSGRTIVSANSKEIKGKKMAKAELAAALGALLAQKAKDAKISQVVFDKGGYKYHGRVKAAADAAREAGLQF